MRTMSRQPIYFFFVTKSAAVEKFISFCVDVGLIVYRASAIRREKFIKNRAILRMYC